MSSFGAPAEHGRRSRTNLLQQIELMVLRPLRTSDGDGEATAHERHVRHQQALEVGVVQERFPLPLVQGRQQCVNGAEVLQAGTWSHLSNR